MSKGSKTRPYSVDQNTFNSNWDSIFNRKKKTDIEKFDDAIMKNDYSDILSTEDALDEMVRINEELGLYDITYNPLIKK